MVSVLIASHGVLSHAATEQAEPAACKLRTQPCLHACAGDLKAIKDDINMIIDVQVQLAASAGHSLLWCGSRSRRGQDSWQDPLGAPSSC